MSHIDDLIAEYCPNGVTIRAIGDTGELVRGNGMPRSDFADSGVGCIHYGQIYTYYGTWATETKSLIPPEKARKLAKVNPRDLIITNTSENIDDVCKAVAWLGTEQIVTGGHATVLKHDQDPKYLSYYLQTPEFFAEKKKRATGTKVIDVSAKSLATIRVPLPPLEVQREIVKVLDTFAALEAELEAELEARRRQYEHYRSELLTAANRECSVVSLDQLGRIITGRTPKSSEAAFWGDEFDFITPSDIKNGMRSVSRPARRLSGSGARALAKNLVPARSILVTCIGADMGKAVINEHDCVTNQQINAIVLSASVSMDYIFHLLTSMRDSLRKQGERSGGTLPIINKSDFSKIEVSIPSLVIQERAASKLNAFDALVNDLSIGLPAELNARRQQYEYYRDKLLTFEKAVA